MSAPTRSPQERLANHFTRSGLQQNHVRDLERLLHRSDSSHSGDRRYSVGCLIRFGRDPRKHHNEGAFHFPGNLDWFLKFYILLTSGRFGQLGRTPSLGAGQELDEAQPAQDDAQRIDGTHHRTVVGGQRAADAPLQGGGSEALDSGALSKHGSSCKRFGQNHMTNLVIR